MVLGSGVERGKNEGDGGICLCRGQERGRGKRSDGRMQMSRGRHWERCRREKTRGRSGNLTTSFEGLTDWRDGLRQAGRQATAEHSSTTAHQRTGKKRQSPPSRTTTLGANRDCLFPLLVVPGRRSVEADGLGGGGQLRVGGVDVVEGTSQVPASSMDLLLLFSGAGSVSVV